MTISKRNGKYYCRFQINGERHHYLCNGAASLKEAELMENAFKYKLMQQQNGLLPREDKARVRLKKLKENFLTYSEINRAVYSQDVGRVNIIFQFFDENKYADTIVRKDVDEFKLWLLNKGRSKKTINLYIGIMRVMFNLGIDNEWLEKNPFKSETEFKLDPVKRKILAHTSQPNLMAATPDYFKPVIIAVLNSALRRDNIRTLKWSYIDLEFRTIEITKNKGKKHIKLPMNKTLFELFSSMERTSEYVFVNPRTGTGWSNTKFGAEWRKIREKAGLPNLKFHDLRHTVATRLLKKNVPVPVVRDLLAHSDIKTTMIYNQTDSLDMMHAIHVLDSYN